MRQKSSLAAVCALSVIVTSGACTAGVREESVGEEQKKSPTQFDFKRPPLSQSPWLGFGPVLFFSKDSDAGHYFVSFASPNVTHAEFYSKGFCTVPDGTNGTNDTVFWGTDGAYVDPTQPEKPLGALVGLQFVPTTTPGQYNMSVARTTNGSDKVDWKFNVGTLSPKTVSPDMGTWLASQGIKNVGCQAAGYLWKR